MIDTSAFAISVAVVRVGGIDQGHARVEGRVNRGDGTLLVGPSLDEHQHAAESYRADRIDSIRPYLPEINPRDVPEASLMRFIRMRDVRLRASAIPSDYSFKEKP